MSIPGGALGFGGGPGGATRFSQTRGRMGNGFNQGVNYPSPFFDIAHTYLPTTVKAMFRWCRYYFLTNPIINATVFKLSEYPITEIEIDHPDKKVANKWKEYFEDHLNYRAFQIECGLDYNTYGNCLTALSFPFQKYLKCRGCGYSAEAKRIRPHWVFTNYEFRMSCPKCNHLGTADVKDQYFRNESGVRVMRWSPEDVEISYSDLTGEYTYFYNIPPGVRNDVIIGKKDAVEQVPEVFIQALRQQKGVVFSKDLFFHLKRPTLADQDRGWGIPLLLPCLKDTFYLQIMKKAQEAILLEHIVPLRILFPQAGSGTSDPYCLTGKTLVEANYSYKRAEDIQVGDLVKTSLGNYMPVTRLKKRAVPSTEGVYRLHVAGMGAEPVEASEKHPFLAVQAEGKQRRKITNWHPSWIDAKDLQIGDFVAYPLARKTTVGMQIDMAQYLESYVATDKWVYQQITPIGAAAYEHVECREQRVFASGELQETATTNGWPVSTLQSTASRYRRGHRTPRVPRYLTWTKSLARIIGYHLAEGCVDEGRLTFTLNANETWICDELDEAFMEVLGEKGESKPHGENGLQYRINSCIFAEFMKNYCGHLAWNKHYPAEVVELPDELLLEVVRGAINGDGGPENVVRDNGTGRPCRTSSVTFTSTSEALALKTRELLLYLGVVGKVHRTPVRKRRKHEVFRVKVNGQQAVDLWRLLGWEAADVEIKKDTSRCFIRGGYAFFRVQKKEKIEGVDYVYGFQVDGDKSFCVPACATHNTTINLVDWRDHVAAEIARWRYDNNYIPILPLPVGNQTIGGDGKALLMVQEMSQMTDQLINGMQVPIEFIKGGLSYAGTNISMRMLENQFIVYLSRHTRMAKWVMRSVADYLEWPMANIRFKPFKMADDIQRKAFLFQLNQAGKVSDTTLLMDSDLDQEQEDEIMVRETSARMDATKKQQLAQAELQGESQVIMMKMQAKAQQELAQATGAPTAPGEPGGPETGAAPPGGQAGGGSPALPAPDPMAQMSSPLNAGQNMGAGPALGMAGTGGPAGQQVAAGGGSLLAIAQTTAMQLSQLDPAQQHLAIKNLRAQSPELADLVLQMLSTMPGLQEQQAQQAQQGQPAMGAAGKAAVQVDMRPLPEQRAPRRAAKAV